MALLRIQTAGGKTEGGFTLIELLVVLVVLAILVAIVAPNYIDRVSEAREVTLKHNLNGLRIAIDQFYKDKARYPNSLEELVQSRYIRVIPIDPVTDRSDTWKVEPPPSAVSVSGKVFNVRSGAPGESKSGIPYSAW